MTFLVRYRVDEQVVHRIREMRWKGAIRLGVPKESQEEGTHLALLELAVAGDRLAQDLRIDSCDLDIADLVAEAFPPLVEQSGRAALQPVVGNVLLDELLEGGCKQWTADIDCSLESNGPLLKLRSVFGVENFGQINSGGPDWQVVVAGRAALRDASVTSTMPSATEVGCAGKMRK